MKGLELTRQFTIGEPEEHEYEHYVNLTAKLIGRPYIQVHKMVEKLPLSEIRDRYIESTKHNGTVPSDVYWWWLRKRK